MFEKSVNDTVRLISRQVTQVETKVPGRPACRVTVNSIPLHSFLTGFEPILTLSPKECLPSWWLCGESVPFQSSQGIYRFNKSYPSPESWRLVCKFPLSICPSILTSSSWSGVVKGAILGGMGIGMQAAPKVKACPRSYGICTSQLYAGWMHNPDQAVEDRFNLKQIVHRQFNWLVRKGDVILSDRPLQSNFDVETRFTSKHLNSRVNMRIIFAATAIDDPPCNLSDLPRGKSSFSLTTITINLDQHAPFVQARYIC
jgi:hypothetical protein